MHLRIHQELVDEGKSNDRIRKPELVYQCDFCPVTFSRVRHFYVHRCKHTGEKPSLSCSHCDLKFSSIEELKKHKLDDHPGMIQQCSLCDKCFFKKTALQRHMITHSQDPVLRPVFPCHHCDSQFTSAAARTVILILYYEIFEYLFLDQYF